METIFLKTQSGTTLKGPQVIETQAFKDQRGIFYESWNSNYFNSQIKKNINFVQDNLSHSTKGVLRGLHYQLDPFMQGKLIRCIKGRIYDVIVDLRQSSDTFLCWSSIELNENNYKQLWIPEGFAHGFLTLSHQAIVQYKVNNYWNNKCERSIKWNDTEINIKWPIKDIYPKQILLSYKDEQAPTFKEAKSNGEIFK